VRASTPQLQLTFAPMDSTNFWSGDFYGHRGVDPENFPQNASVESLEELIEHACRRVPKLQNAEIMRGVTGVYDMTPDSRPPLREIPGVDGLFVCAGFSGMGFSRAIGLVMSELLLDGCGKTVDISLFGSVGLPRGFLSRRNTSTKTTRFVVPSRRPCRPAELRAERLMKVAEGSAQKSRKGAMHEKERSS
jgi:hypothetical protein